MTDLFDFLVMVSMELSSFLILAETWLRGKLKGKELLAAVFLGGFSGRFFLYGVLGRLRLDSVFLSSAPVLFLLLVLVYEGKIWKKLGFFAMYYGLYYGTAFAVTGCTRLAAGNYAGRIQENPMLGTLETVLWESVFTVCCFALARIRENRGRPRRSFAFWVQMLLIPAAMVLNLLLVFYYAVQMNRVPGWITADMLLLLAGNLLFLFLGKRMEAARSLAVENQALEEQVREEEKRQELILENYRKQRSLTHDFHSHLCVLDGLLEKEAYQKAREYIRRLSEEEAGWEEWVHTGHAVTDTILGRFYREAEKRGVAMELELALEPGEDGSPFGRSVSCPDGELAVILSNLLQNALEAAEKAREKRIIVRISRRNSRILFSVRNTVADLQEKERMGELRSLEHGYGMKNIARLVQKNSGQYAAERREGWFQSTVVLPER